MERGGVRKSVDQLIKRASNINGLSLSLICEIMTSSVIIDNEYVIHMIQYDEIVHVTIFQIFV